jgi:hypothetical protein
MLAQNFKTAADLGISDAELDALIKVLGMLDRGDLVHVGPQDQSKPNGFNMSPVLRHNECGTVGCIAGWVKVISGEFINETPMRRDQRDAWGGLIMPPGYDWSCITIEQSATALRSYLTTGDANWAEALSAS